MMYVPRTLVVFAAGATISLPGCATKGKVTSQEVAGSVASSMPALSGALAPATQLVSSLMASIPGLSEAQAILGAGSLFGLAKAKMPGDQFSQLASAVPGTQALVDEATKAGLPAADQLTGLASLTPVLSKAGINAGTTTQLVSALTKAVSGAGGQGLADAFAAAVK